jgi:hypothetical protein
MKFPQDNFKRKKVATHTRSKYRGGLVHSLPSLWFLTYSSLFNCTMGNTSGTRRTKVPTPFLDRNRARKNKHERKNDHDTQECHELASIIGLQHADIEYDREQQVCSVEGSRDLGTDVVYLPTGRAVRSNMVRTVEITFEPRFNEVEITLLDEEIPSFIAALVKQRIFTISAIHNHEILISPPVKYVHASSGADAHTFARALRTVFDETISPATNKSLFSTLH